MTEENDVRTDANLFEDPDEALEPIDIIRLINNNRRILAELFNKLFDIKHNLSKQDKLTLGRIIEDSNKVNLIYCSTKKELSEKALAMREQIEKAKKILLPYIKDVSAAR